MTSDPFTTSSPLIAPSILSADFAKLGAEIDEVLVGGGDFLHLDVMDGHFVPNISFGPPIIKAVRKVTPVFLDVHLMISEPLRYAPAMVDAGADALTFHVEAVHDVAAATTYMFRVAATNASGRSAPSGTASATTNPAGWDTYGEASVSATSQQIVVTVGVAGRAAGDSQPSGVHGASILLAPAASLTLEFTPDLSTWDSYSPGDSGSTGYWGSFSVSLTDQPYPQLNLTDPLDLPFIWGGQDYGSGSLETYTTPRTITLTGDPTKAMYLNVVLDTGTTTHADGAYPSWGTFTITATNPLPAHEPERVGVVGRQFFEQAAEGGGPAQFVFYRMGTDTSQKIDVNYTVGGTATTGGADYTALSGTVTIPVGEHTATVDVSALADADAAEGTETVTVSVAGGQNYEPAPGVRGNATVQILDHKKYFYYFYGFFGGPGKFADAWQNALRDELQASQDYEGFAFTENKMPQALRDLLQRLDADGNRRISAAEAESCDVRVGGWSFGGTSAIDFTIALNKVGKRLGWSPGVPGYLVEAKVRVKDLVTWDPVNFLAFKRPDGPVQTNVDSFHNYYQQHSGISDFQRFDALGNRIGHEPIWSPLGLLVKGGERLSNVPGPGTVQVRVDEDPRTATVIVRRNRVYPNLAPVDPPLWELPGYDVNHDTIGWWAYEETKNVLST